MNGCFLINALSQSPLPPKTELYWIFIIITVLFILFYIILFHHFVTKVETY